ncbi:MAG TPA: hypothetical protein VF080_03035, partial [Solirubrobacteraceae bacterium]
VPRVSDWLVLLLGLVLLGMVFSERHDVPRAWKRPSSWLTRDPQEAMRSRAPSQPLNAVLGVILGLGAVVYATIALVT